MGFGRSGNDQTKTNIYGSVAPGLTYPHPESYLAGSSNRVNLTEYTRFGLLSLKEIPPKLKIHPETR